MVINACFTPTHSSISACIPTSNGTDQCISFCPEKCRAGSSCKNGCPVCQDGWTEPYCERKDLIFIVSLQLPYQFVLSSGAHFIYYVA